MPLRRITAALVLFGFTLGSAALTIGRPQGDVWIGRPLDLIIALVVNESESGGGLCIESDVTLGETRIPDRRLTVSLAPGARPDTPNIRVRSTLLVNEPVVHVRLSVGCQSPSTRSFVLLAELPPQHALPGAAPSEWPTTSRFAAPLPERSERTALTASTVAAAPPRRVAAPRKRSPSTQAQAQKQTPAQTPAKKVGPRAAAAPNTNTNTNTNFKTTATAKAPVAIPSAAVVALAVVPALERDAALAVPAASVQAQGLPALEAAQAVLRRQLTESQAALRDMRVVLAQAHDSHYRNPLVYGLVAALLLALVAIAWLWRAMRRAHAMPVDWPMDTTEYAAHAAEASDTRDSAMQEAQLTSPAMSTAPPPFEPPRVIKG